MTKIINFFEDIENKLNKDGEHYSEGNRNNYVLQFARIAKGKGISESDCLQYVLNNYPEAEKRDVNAPATVKSVYNYNGLQAGQYSNGQKPEQLNGTSYFSVFNCSVFAKSENQKPYKNVHLDGLASILKTEEKAKEISKLQYGSPEYKAKKEQYSHYFTPHGTFTQRKNDSLKILSKYFLFEADKNENPNIDPNELTNKLKKDKRVALCFQSFSGFPKWLVRVPGVIPENFRDKYQEAAKNFEKEYNIKCDKGQGKLSQPCYFSYDPDVYINHNSQPLILESDEVKEEQTPADLLQNAKIDLSEEIPEPPTILHEGNEIFATKGNISTIIGKAKSKKSFLVTLKAAEYLQNNSGKLLFFDTEQSKFHVQKVGLRLQKMSDVSNLNLFALRPLNTEERIKVIEYAIYNTPNAELVVIDGIRDLINDINDPHDATKISDFLLRWTNDTNVHIINILHQNKGDNNARGHVGTELVNKSETVASVKKDDVLNPELSIVEAEYTRNPPFEKFAFYVNQHGLPERGEVPEAEGKEKGTHPGQFGEIQHKQVLNKIFAKKDTYTYTELFRAVKTYFNIEHKISFGDNKARDFVQYYEAQNYIKNESENHKAKYKLC
jgi:hypothetical protein